MVRSTLPGRLDYLILASAAEAVKARPSVRRLGKRGRLAAMTDRGYGLEDAGDGPLPVVNSRLRHLTRFWKIAAMNHDETSGLERIYPGMFIMPFHDPAKPLGQCYDEDLELIVRAEELGFREFWIGEHHTMKYENIVMPEIFIARALGETKRIRLGPAPVCLNQHHPAHVAGRLSFLDHLSKGRLNLCFGAGSVSTDQELFGAEPKNAAAMVDEATDMILRLWSSEPPYEIEGKFWSIRLKKSVDAETGIGYIHKPYQKPHPPIAVPGTSCNSPSMRIAGQRGFQPFGHCLIAGNVLADLWHTYETAALEAGRKPQRADYKVARSIFLADTTPEARRLARTNSLGKNFQYIGRLCDKGNGRRMFK